MIFDAMCCGCGVLWCLVSFGPFRICMPLFIQYYVMSVVVCAVNGESIDMSSGSGHTAATVSTSTTSIAVSNGDVKCGIQQQQQHSNAVSNNMTAEVPVVLYFFIPFSRRH